VVRLSCLDESVERPATTHSAPRLRRIAPAITVPCATNRIPKQVTGSLAQEATQQRGGSVEVLEHGPASVVAVTREDRLDDRVMLLVGVFDVALQ
jgi:hypothetical protein